jgi:hypothetical protein
MWWRRQTGRKQSLTDCFHPHHLGALRKQLGYPGSFALEQKAGREKKRSLVLQLFDLYLLTQRTFAGAKYKKKREKDYKNPLQFSLLKYSAGWDASIGGCTLSLLLGTGNKQMPGGKRKRAVRSLITAFLLSYLLH